MLKHLTPPPLQTKINIMDPVEEGSITDFIIAFGPMSVRWVAEHKDVDFPNSFKDLQKEGPFDHWSHTHSFKRIDQNTTEVIDTIQAEPARRGLNWFLSRFMWLNLPILFSYRAKRTKGMLEK